MKFRGRFDLLLSAVISLIAFFLGSFLLVYTWATSTWTDRLVIVLLSSVIGCIPWQK